MRLLPCGDTGLLVELADLDAVLALYAELVEDPPEGVVDLVPAARTLMLRIDPAARTPRAWAGRCRSVATAAGQPSRRRPGGGAGHLRRRGPGRGRRG